MKYSQWLFNQNAKVPKSTASLKKRREAGKVVKHIKASTARSININTIESAPLSISSESNFESFQNETADIDTPHENVTNQNVETEIHMLDDNSYRIDVNDEKNMNLLCSALLTLFFRENLTQSALAVNIKHTQLFTKLEIPKSLNQLFSLLTQSESSPESSKVWYCSKCKQKIVLNNSKQRKCQKCGQRYKSI